MKRFVAILVCLLSVNIVSEADETLTVEPLVKVEWGQYAPFNQFCPKMGTGNAAAGCVAVTMAQAMSVYKSIDAGDMTAVASLLAECGAAAQTIYGESSTATIGNQVRALVRRYDFDADMTIRNREFSNREEWKSVIETELKNGRPVMVSATDPAYGGHSFIIDGCRNDSVHINWGWTGSWNGYYSLDNLNPGNYHFTDNQRIVAGFMPDDYKAERDSYWEGVCSLSDVEMNVDDIVPVSCYMRLLNCLYRTYDGYLYVYLLTPDGKKKRITYWFLSDYDLDYQYNQDFSFTPPSEPGEYFLLVEMKSLMSGKITAAKIVGDVKVTVKPSATGITNNTCGQKDQNVRKIVRNGRLVIATPNGEYSVSGTQLRP